MLTIRRSGPLSGALHLGAVMLAAGFIAVGFVGVKRYGSNYWLYRGFPPPVDPAAKNIEEAEAKKPPGR